MRDTSGAWLCILTAFVSGCAPSPDSSLAIPGAQGGSQTAQAGSTGSTSRGGTSPGGAGNLGTGGSLVTAGSSAAGGVPATTVTYPKACSDIYEPSLLPVFELQIAPDQMALIESDCEQELKEWRPAVFKYGTETADVMVRLKGNWSWRCEKKQFLISFNEVNPDGRFHGLRKIVLDSPWYEPSLLAERIGFSFMRRLGAPWSCANNAKLMINGAYYGAYTNVERIDKEYLQRHFSDLEAEGNLYDGGVELKTNETLNDVSRRDALMAATNVATIDNLTDLDEVVKVWAGSAMLPDPDSYWAGVEINYYLYDHPSRGFLWLPYDMDLTMRQGVTNDETSTIEIGIVNEFVRADPFTYQNAAWGREPLFRTVLSDQRFCTRFLEEFRLARAAYDVDFMSREIDTWSEQIADAVAQDPRKPFSTQNHVAAVANLKAFMRQRLAFVDGWLPTATCPVARWPR